MVSGAPGSLVGKAMTDPRESLMTAPNPATTHRTRLVGLLRGESTGGVLLIIGAMIALIWANSRWAQSYDDLRNFTIGPASLHLDLSLSTWAADGLLAIFFFVTGLELKREFVVGNLRDPRRALLPVGAAVGGMAAPALIFLAINATNPGALSGWAIPTATDIAFAVAVLAVVSSHLPLGLRTFLLTLAVVDDLLAIIVIACFYTSSLNFGWLALAVLPLAAFGWLAQREIRRPELLIPLAVATWVLVHASGIHATVAGVALAFCVPVLSRHPKRVEASAPGAPTVGLAQRWEHALAPVSAGFAVPVFAFLAAGVTVGGWSGLSEALTDRVALGIMAGLIVGKPIGIMVATWVLVTFTNAELDDELHWADIFGVAILGGVGFTVSLLVGDLAYADTADRAEQVKVGVLAGSVAAGAVAAAVLAARNRRYRAGTAGAGKPH